MRPWRPICRQDRDDYVSMATAFYHTNAVMKPIPTTHIEATFDELMRTDTYTSAYICETANGVVGYALVAKTFSQEAGGYVVWVEELYLKDDHRRRGLGRAFFRFLLDSLPASVKRVRLEVERDNEQAVKLYQSFGFDFFEYDQMALER